MNKSTLCSMYTMHTECLITVQSGAIVDYLKAELRVNRACGMKEFEQ